MHQFGYHRELSHLEGCGPHLRLWHQFYHPCQGSCGSQVGIWTSHAVTQLEVHSLTEVHFLGEVAYHSGTLVPSAQSCHIWSILNPLWAVHSVGWVLSCATGAVPGGCRWCGSNTIMAGVGSLALVMVDCIHRFGTVGDLFLSLLDDKVVHCNVS